MSLIVRAIGCGGVAAFFFFSWIIQLLWNAILVDQLALVPVRLNYWQAAAAWFLASLLSAWVGIGARPLSWGRPQRAKDADALGDRIERAVSRHVRRWAEDTEDDDDLGERIEAKIKRGLGRWVGANEDTDWDELGERIARKIKEKLRDEFDTRQPRP